VRKDEVVATWASRCKDKVCSILSRYCSSNAKNDGKKAERKAYSLAVENEVAKFILKENLKEISDRVTVNLLKNL